MLKEGTRRYSGNKPSINILMINLGILPEVHYLQPFTAGGRVVTEKTKAYESIFYPGRLAIMDASADKNRPVGALLDALLLLGFQGSLSLIASDERNVRGLQTVASLAQLKPTVDLLVSDHEGASLCQQVEVAISNRVKNILLLCGRSPATDLPSHLITRLREAGIRLIGPDSFGIYSPSVGMTLINGSDFPTDSGDIGLITQSGLGACDIIYTSIGRGLRFSKAITTGREYDLSTAEMLDFFADDRTTRLTGAIIDNSIIDENLLHSINNHLKKKPLIILYQGSHEEKSTHSLEYSSRALIQSTGVVTVRTIPELVDNLMAFSLLQKKPLMRIGAIAENSAQATEIAQSALQEGFSLPDPAEYTTGETARFSADSGQALFNPAVFRGSHSFQQLGLPLLDLYAAHPSIDITVISQRVVTEQTDDVEDQRGARPGIQALLVGKAEEIQNESGKQIVLILPECGPHPDLRNVEQKRMLARTFYTHHGIPCFDSAQAAFHALSSFHRYHLRRGQGMRDC